MRALVEDAQVEWAHATPLRVEAQQVRHVAGCRRNRGGARPARSLNRIAPALTPSRNDRSFFERRNANASRVSEPTPAWSREPSHIWRTKMTDSEFYGRCIR